MRLSAEKGRLDRSLSSVEQELVDSQRQIQLLQVGGTLLTAHNKTGVEGEIRILTHSIPGLSQPARFHFPTLCPGPLQFFSCFSHYVFQNRTRDRVLRNAFF